jgi:hypothetical protein
MSTFFFALCVKHGPVRPAVEAREKWCEQKFSGSFRDVKCAKAEFSESFTRSQRMIDSLHAFANGWTVVLNRCEESLSNAIFSWNLLSRGCVGSMLSCTTCARALKFPAALSGMSCENIFFIGLRQTDQETKRLRSRHSETHFDSYLRVLLLGPCSGCPYDRDVAWDMHRKGELIRRETEPLFDSLSKWSWFFKIHKQEMVYSKLWKGNAP